MDHLKRFSTIRNLQFAFLISGLLSISAFSQKKDPEPKMDDLTSLPYISIQEMENEAFENDNINYLRELSKAHVKKARKEKNEIEIARGFYYRTITEEPQLALLYADSIIEVTKNSDHPNYPILGYSLKAHINYNIGNLETALDYYLKAYKLALEKDNKNYQKEMSLAIAAIRNINGQHYSAAEIYLRYLSNLKKETNFESTYYEEYILLLYNLSLAHLRMAETDSARYYAKRGIEKVVSVKDNYNYKDFILLDAQINYYSKDYIKARDSLLKYVDSLQGTAKAIKLYYLGKIEEKLDNQELQREYFKQIDSIVTQTKDPFNELKDVYQRLISYSVLTNDKHKQIEYLDKLIRYDSILSSGKEEIINKAVASYDIPFLKHQKKQVEEQLKRKSKFIALTGILASLGLFSGIHFFVRANRMKIKLKHLLDEGPKTRKVAIDDLGHPSSVPEDIREDLLRKLNAFENSDRFLCKNLDMSLLAQEFETNTSYLSVMVNHYKQMSFPNYLKDLKITRAIAHLTNDSELLKYNYQGLADLFGFKTGESFSKAFYSKTGVHPSKFLNELKSRKITRHL